MNNLKNTKTRAPGFTLIEVLVALGVLSIIVLMMSMAFHQSSDAWTAATHRAGMDMMARNIVGRVELDLSQAVPASNYPGDNTALAQTFKSDEISFLRLRVGTGGQRELRKVVYKENAGVVTRREHLVEYKPPTPTADGVWSVGDAVSDEQLNETDTAFLKFEFRVVQGSGPDGGATKLSYDLPESVDVYACVTYQGRFAHFRSRSFGPNGQNSAEKGYIYAGGSK